MPQNGVLHTYNEIWESACLCAPPTKTTHIFHCCLYLFSIISHYFQLVRIFTWILVLWLLDQDSKVSYAAVQCMRSHCTLQSKVLFKLHSSVCLTLEVFAGCLKLVSFLLNTVNIVLPVIYPVKSIWQTIWQTERFALATTNKILLYFVPMFLLGRLKEVLVTCNIYKKYVTS